MTHLTTYQMDIESSKTKDIFGSEWLMGFSKMGHLIKLNKQKNILGQDGN